MFLQDPIKLLLLTTMPSMLRKPELVISSSPFLRLQSRSQQDHALQLNHLHTVDQESGQT